MSTTPTVPTPDLPADITLLIACVVKATRLRRAEREDLTRELTAHFRDGLETGQSASELLAAFGDATASARQLRAATIAKRSPLDRALRSVRIAAGWTSLAFVAFYAASIGYLWLNAPVVSIDVIAQLNALIPQAPESERAWPLFKRALVALGDTADPSARSVPEHVVQFKELGDVRNLALPWDEHWQREGELLKDRAAGFELLAQAASRPVLGYIPGLTRRAEDADVIHYSPNASPSTAPNFPAFSLLLPHLALQRQAARLAATDALHALDENDGARAVRDFAAIIGLARHAEEGAYFISQLVGSAIRALAFDRIIMALEWKPDAFTDEQLAQLAQMLRAIPDSAYCADMRAEFLGLSDCIQRLYSDDGNGDGWYNPVYGGPLLLELTPMVESTSQQGDRSDFWESSAGVLLSPMGAAVVASRKETLDLCASMFDKTVAQSRLPLWQQDLSFADEFETLCHESQRAQLKWMIPRLLLPAVARVAEVRRKGQAQSIAAQVAIAMTQFHRANQGAWPSSLAELVPNYLPEAPLDPWTGKELAYERNEAGPVIWTTLKRPHENPVPESERWIWFNPDKQLTRWVSALKQLAWLTSSHDRRT